MTNKRHLIGILVCLAMTGCHSTAPRFGLGRNSSKSTEIDEQITSNGGDSNLTNTAAESKPPVPPASRKPAGVLLQEGQLALRTGDFDQAEQRFQDVLKSDPLNATAHHRLAVIADQQKDYLTAEKHYLVALQGNPHDANLLSDMGYSYMLQGKNENAKRFLSDALDRNPKHPQAANNLGAIYAQEGYRDQALEMFRLSGTEQEAQAKLAYVMNQNTSSTFASSPKAEPKNPARSSPLTIDPEFSAAQNGAIDGGGTSVEHQRIVEQMREAREAATLKRRQNEQLMASSRQALPRPDGYDIDPRYPAAEEFPEISYDETQASDEYQQYGNALDNNRYEASSNLDYGVPNNPRSENRMPPAEMYDSEYGETDPNAYWPPEDNSLNTGSYDRRSSQTQKQNPQNVNAYGIQDSYNENREDVVQVGRTAESHEPYGNQNQDQMPQFNGYLETGEQSSASTGFVNPSSSNPRRYASQNAHAGTDEASRKAAMLAGLNAGPSQLFPVQSGMTSQSSGYDEFPATETRLGSQFSQPSRSMPGETEIENWPSHPRNSYETNRPVSPSQPITRMGYEYTQPERTTSARYQNLNEDAIGERLPSAWDEASPSMRALQEQSQYNRR
ncbi:MAG: tetratricopeptide repeat protein [Planctomycetota bacterium]|nr:tetratricopeptide repeat protein [Planctomycetota bacterium]MDA1213485.1 tetratricopeptide repeat protein [Planctomycetota bacterium]